MAQYGLTEQGPNPKRLDVILEEMHESMSKRLGVNTRLNPESLLNHLLTNVADRIAELWEYGTDVYLSQYPSSAEGISLDYAAQFGGTTREMPAKSYYRILCTGTDGTLVPAGTIISSNTNPATNLTLPEDGEITRASFNQAAIIVNSPDSAYSIALDETLYTIDPDLSKSVIENLTTLSEQISEGTDEFQTSIDIDNEALIIHAVDVESSHVMVLSENLTTKSVGSILMFATVDDGDIVIPNGVITKIVKAVAGLETVVNVGTYIAGRLEETDVEFRKSYTDKIFARSSRMLESIRSAILSNVQGVSTVAVYENPSHEWDDYGRPPHSVEVVAEGGDATEIAQQILNTKAGGINTYGNVEVELPGLYGENITIRFNRPNYIQIWFRVGVTLSPNTNPPTNYAELIKEQILAKMEELEAGDSVIPQKFKLDVSGIDYIDVWMFATADIGEMPDKYDKRSITISARERAVSDESRIEVVIDG